MSNTIKQIIHLVFFLAPFIPPTLLSQTEMKEKADSIAAIVENYRATATIEFGDKIDHFFLLLHAELAELSYKKYVEGKVLCYKIDNSYNLGKEKLTSFFSNNDHLLKSIGLRWSIEDSLEEDTSSFILERMDKTILVILTLGSFK